MSVKHIRDHEIIGVCELNKKWAKLQYKDQWGDETSFYIPITEWKKMGRPVTGDRIHIEVICTLLS